MFPKPQSSPHHSNQWPGHTLLALLPEEAPRNSPGDLALHPERAGCGGGSLMEGPGEN